MYKTGTLLIFLLFSIPAILLPRASQSTSAAGNRIAAWNDNVAGFRGKDISCFAGNDVTPIVAENFVLKDSFLSIQTAQQGDAGNRNLPPAIEPNTIAIRALHPGIASHRGRTLKPDARNNAPVLGKLMFIAPDAITDVCLVRFSSLEISTISDVSPPNFFAIIKSSLAIPHSWYQVKNDPVGTSSWINTAKINYALPIPDVNGILNSESANGRIDQIETPSYTSLSLRYQIISRIAGKYSICKLAATDGGKFMSAKKILLLQ